MKLRSELDPETLKEQRNTERVPDSSEEQFVERGHNPPGIAWWIAKWLSERGSYDEAALFLREEADGRYSPPESWQLSTILALGGILQAHYVMSPSETVRKYFADNPSQQKLLHGVVDDLWPTFSPLIRIPGCIGSWLGKVQSAGPCQILLRPYRAWVGTSLAMT